MQESDLMLSKVRGAGQGTGGSAQGDGGAKYCVCSKCGYNQKHVKTSKGQSIPCTKMKCPKCKTALKGSATKTLSKEALSKPYPNFHSARVKAPALFLRVRVLQTTKTGVMIYGGPLKTDPRGASKTQSVRFPKDKFTTTQAKAWLKENKQKYILFEPASEEKKKYWPSITGE